MSSTNRISSISNHLQLPKNDFENPQKILFIANRGIPTVRIARTARSLGFLVVGAVTPQDSLEHFPKFSYQKVHEYTTDGPEAYTNVSQVLLAARALKADFIHPGIGFLSENASFALQCRENGLKFVGPSRSVLELFGNKHLAGELARELRVPVLGLGMVAESGELTRKQLQSLPLLFKAVDGGGGLGLRIVNSKEDAKVQYERCASEVARSVGKNVRDVRICAERYLLVAKHVEVQIFGTGTEFYVLGDRECSVQRRFQKMIEIGPAPDLSVELRTALHQSALALAKATQFESLGTFEFLVVPGTSEYYFIECNPRLQVEHTVTEQVIGLDLVELQLRLAAGMPLPDLTKITQRGMAIQCRVNAEVMSSLGMVMPVPAGSRIKALDFPRGRGIRVETWARAGSRPSLLFDSLLAQIIVHDEFNNGSFKECVKKVRTAMDEFHVIGCPTNAKLLRMILQDDRFYDGQATTMLLDEKFFAKYAEFDKSHPDAMIQDDLSAPSIVKKQREQEFIDEHDGTLIVSSPMQALVVSVLVRVGDVITANSTTCVVLTSLKMEHEIKCTKSGLVTMVHCKENAQMEAGEEMFRVDVAANLAGFAAGGTNAHALHHEKSPLLIQLEDAIKYHTLDSSRVEKFKRILKDKTRITTREVLSKMFDYEESKPFEYGRLASNGYQKHSVGDGLYALRGFVNARNLKPQRPLAMVVAYDFSVLAGTQGLIGHKKKDRVFDLAMREKLPIVLFAEGGGGRAGDAKAGGFTSSGLDGPAFTLFAKLAVAGVPLIGAVTGFSFAGNAALLGTCDVIVATKNASVGMGGPAMIEGGGLGVVKPEDVGPIQMHFEKGVVDVLVDDDEALVVQAKKVLSYFQGPILNWTAPDQEKASESLRSLVPWKNRRLAFDIRVAINHMFDQGSMTEIKAGYAKNLIAGFGRLKGNPIGYLANDCRFLSGCLDAYGSSKMTEFIKLCSKAGLPIVVFVDTPGFLVGPEAERHALVKRAGELFVAGVGCKVPMVNVVLRRCVGLGGQAMCGGDLKVPLRVVSWPSGEFGAMGFEGAVRLGFRDEIKDNPEMFDTLVAAAYDMGKALKTAERFEIDDVIDPADTRAVVCDALGYF